jgi:hypothetical protein
MPLFARAAAQLDREVRQGVFNPHFVRRRNYFQYLLPGIEGAVTFGGHYLIGRDPLLDLLQESLDPRMDFIPVRCIRGAAHHEACRKQQSDQLSRPSPRCHRTIQTLIEQSSAAQVGSG